MAAPSIFSKFLHRAYHTCPQGIQMNVPEEFQEIRLRLDGDRPEPVLEQMPHPVMPPVEIQGVSRHQAMHESGEDTVFDLKQKVKMIRQESPCQAGSPEPLKVEADPAVEFLPVLVVRENNPFLDPPRVDVVECAGEIDPWSSCHAAGRCTDHSRKKLKNVPFLLEVQDAGGENSLQVIRRKWSRVRESPTGKETVGSYPMSSFTTVISARESRTSPARDGSNRGATRRPASPYRISRISSRETRSPQATLITLPQAAFGASHPRTFACTTLSM